MGLDLRLLLIFLVVLSACSAILESIPSEIEHCEELDNSAGRYPRITDWEKCISEQAITDNNPSLCDEAGNFTGRGSARDKCYMRVAAHFNDSSLCPPELGEDNYCLFAATKTEMSCAQEDYTCRIEQCYGHLFSKSYIIGYTMGRTSMPAFSGCERQIVEELTAEGYLVEWQPYMERPETYTKDVTRGIEIIDIQYIGEEMQTLLREAGKCPLDGEHKRTNYWKCVDTLAANDYRYCYLHDHHFASASLDERQSNSFIVDRFYEYKLSNNPDAQSKFWTYIPVIQECLMVHQ